MTLESGFPPAPVGDIARAGRLAAQRRENLCPINLDIRRIEAGRGQRQPQQIEGVVAILHKRAQRAADLIAIGRKVHLNGFAFEPVREGLGIEPARALVEQRSRKIGGARFARRVLNGAAGKGKVH